MSASPISLDPLLDQSWVSVRYIAYHYNRAIRTVRKWCANGTLVEFGFIVHQDAKGQWWIKLPEGSTEEVKSNIPPVINPIPPELTVKGPTVRHYEHRKPSEQDCVGYLVFKHKDDIEDCF